VQIIAGSSATTLPKVPVQIRNLDRGLRGRLSPPSVALTLRGTDQAVRGATVEALDAHIDATGLKAGDHMVEVMTRPVEGLTVETVRPRTLQLRITKS
jgi:hypothetical protein